ncbi:male accessory gland serine protease inhibitor-like [Lucilia sericata]|uniref:male accessory gland serine protease inhibitor-like n=1 Tax=Lucilia sericata TaxID=13632 RepID=UPI0018A80132|nr:male accessory gland serine protease inhibitor-like [Lucilia sericata]
MKLFQHLCLILLALVADCSSQRCRNSPRVSTCVGPRNTGRICRGCLPSIMWYYDGRQCHEMRFLGASGNSNRWCTRAICEQRCRR